MSTIKTTNIQHPSAASPSIVLASTGNATYAATHDFTAATVTGAGGLRLITPTSIANSGGTATASGGAVTFTGVTSVSLNGIFTSTYENYRIVISGTNTTNSRYQMRLRAAGSDNSASNYLWSVIQMSTASGGAVASTNGAGLTTSWAIADVSTPTGHASLDIFQPQITAATGFMGLGNTNYPSNVAYPSMLGGALSVTTAYDGFTLFPSTGAATGIMRVYGYQNS